MMDDLFRWAARMQSFDAVPLLIKITLLLLIGRLVIAALPRATAALRFAVAMMTLAGALVLPLTAIAPMRLAIPILPALADEVAIDVPEPAASAITIDVVARALPAPVAQPIALSQRILSTWRGWLLMIYAGVAALAFARLSGGILAVRRIVRQGTRVEDDAVTRELETAASLIGIHRMPLLLVSNRTEVPVMWGVTRAVLILPSAAREWSTDRLRVVFLHELAHWKRRDVFALLMMRVTTAIYWFHPAVWSLERIARRECERACDDVVLCSGTRATDYADHLLAIARSMPRSEPFGAVTVAMSRPAELEGRLLAILHDQIRRTGLSLSTTRAMVLVMLAIAIPLGAAQITHRTAEEKMKLAVKRGIPGGVKGGVPGGIEDGVKGGVEGGVTGGVKGSADEMASRGSDYLRHRRLDEAIEELSNAVRANPFHGSARYNLACAYALRGDSNLALRTLRDAVLHGYSGSDHMRKDDDLESIRGPELDAIADLGDQLVIAQGGSDWRPAIARYERFANAHPDIARAWFNYGFVLLAARENARAIDVYKRVLAAGYRPDTTMYNLACGYALLGDRESSLQWLRRAEDAGFDVGGYAANDPDLDNVRNDPWLSARTAAHESKKSNKHKDKDE